MSMVTQAKGSVRDRIRDFSQFLSNATRFVDRDNEGGRIRASKPYGPYVFITMDHEDALQLESLLDDILEML